MSDAVTLQFEILEDGEAVEQFEFDRDVVKVGKLAGSHLQLEDASVSRIHAVIEERSDGSYTLIDLGSSEGTYVNGGEITKQELSDGDVLRFGDQKVRFHLTEGTRTGARSARSETSSRTGSRMSGSSSFDSSRSQSRRDGDRTSRSGSDRDRDSGERGTTVTTEDGRQVEPYTLEGYYDDAGRYIPGYYDDEGEYHFGYGYYDDNDQWQVDYGYYDPDGEWVPTDEPVRSAKDIRTHRTPDRPSDRDAYTHDFFNDKGGDTLEIAHLWGDHVLSVTSFEDPDTVTVGPNASDDLQVGAGSIREAQEDASLPVVTRAGDGGMQLVVSEDMTGYLRRGEDDHTLEELVEQGIARSSPELSDAWLVPIGPESRARLELDDNILLIHFTDMPPSIGGGFVGLDLHALPYLAISAAAHILFLMLAMSLPGEAGDLQMDRINQKDRFVEMMVQPEKKKPKKPDWLGDDEKKKASSQKGEESKAGQKESQKKDKEMAVKGPPDNDNTKLRKEKNKKVAMNAAKEVFSSDQVASPFGSGSQSVGSDAIQAIGNMDGESKGSAQGFGGLGLKGAGRGGGGGMDERGLGIGEVGTAGRGKGKNYGKGAQDIEDKEEKQPEVVPRDPGVQGALDKEIIRKVVRQHRREVKYCYEQQLQKNPELSGQVVIRFTISPTGDVVNAVVEKTTLNSTAVEQCMKGKIRHWAFPQPKGGGLVKVNYPFNFAAN